jgi:hypothetical protein
VDFEVVEFAKNKGKKGFLEIFWGGQTFKLVIKLFCQKDSLIVSSLPMGGYGEENKNSL